MTEKSLLLFANYLFNLHAAASQTNGLPSYTLILHGN